MCIGALVYWAVGFALTFGPDAGRFMGSDYFFFNNMPGMYLIEDMRLFFWLAKINMFKRKHCILKIMRIDFQVKKTFKITVFF